MSKTWLVAQPAELQMVEDRAVIRPARTGHLLQSLSLGYGGLDAGGCIKINTLGERQSLM